jgi:hypothetical protein
MVARRAHEELIEAICEQVLRRRFDDRKDANLAEEVRKRLERHVGEVSKLMSGSTNASAINKAAKQLRTLLEGTFPDAQRLGVLLRSSPQSYQDGFKEQLEWLKWLEKIKGWKPNSDPLKWLDAECARILIQEFSKARPTINPQGPLRMISSLVHEYRTGKPNQNLERACKAVLNAANPKYWGPQASRKK